MTEAFSITDKLIGKGAFGSVFLATDNSGRNYAVKKIQTANYDKKTLDTEIENLKLLSNPCHKYILCLKSVVVDEQSKLIYIFSDYYTGKNIRKEYLKYMKKSLKEADDFLYQAAIKLLSALEILQSKNIIHNDIKINNIIIQDTDPYLIDFGLSCIQSNKCKGGTPIYLAPEVAKAMLYQNNTNYRTFSTDLWSLGITLYKCIQRDKTSKYYWPPNVDYEDFIYELANIKFKFKVSTKNYKLKKLIQTLLSYNPEFRMTVFK